MQQMTLLPLVPNRKHSTAPPNPPHLIGKNDFPNPVNNTDIGLTVVAVENRLYSWFSTILDLYFLFQTDHMWCRFFPIQLDCQDV